MQQRGNPQKQTLPLPKAVDFLHAVEDLQRDLRHRLGVPPAGQIPGGDVLCRHHDIVFKIMFAVYETMFFPIVVGDPVG